MPKGMVAPTPLMRQYSEMKRKHPDAVLLFRVGDFYETFSDDAIIASEILGITLTRRANGAASSVELAGFPHHALDTYLPKLVRAGKRVAICEQLEDPKLTTKLVKRGITELVTPGVTMSESVLENKENNFLGALHFGPAGKVGVAFLDISTGEYLVAEGDENYVGKLMQSFNPKEVLVERGKKERMLFMAEKYLTFELDDWIYTPQAANDRLLKQFGTNSLKGFGVTEMPCGIIAAGSILHYLDITCHTQIGHITTLSRVEEDKYVRLDRFTVRNLEIFHSLAEDGKSLLDVLDFTATPMGGRLLRRDMAFPLREPADIKRRLDGVDYFFKNHEKVNELRAILARMGDIERIVSKVASDRGTPREALGIRRALECIAPIRKLCNQSTSDAVKIIGEQLSACSSLLQTLVHNINPDAPLLIEKCNVIRNGVNEELDNLRALSTNSRQYLEDYRQREIKRTGIPTLKISYNNVYGYYIEVTNTHRDKVPDDWIRRQTISNAERYITPELKKYEEQITTADQRIKDIEKEEFDKVLATIKSFVPALKLDSQLIARLDVTASMAMAALENDYTMPAIDDSLEISITDGRHPVIEKEMPPGEPYISNSVELSNEDNQIMMITGPNMSGKSALLRQVALIVLMAQAGSFVPAREARIGVVDKIFTRVGASDNISQGESTFMVEMNEASSILNNMSHRSLILFDELGRGTSTYDGISIAWAIVEYIHNHGTMHPKTLFATHYHELNEMAESYDRVHNFNVTVQEVNGKVVFLRKLAKGGSDRSFGIHVAKLAGMPPSIVSRADEILRKLEKRERDGANVKIDTLASGEGVQMSFFNLDDPLLSDIRNQIVNLDINTLSPLAALNKLNDIKSLLLG